MGKFVVVTKTFFQPEIKQELLKLTEAVLPIFKKQPGLISIQMHMDTEEKHTMTFMEWASEEDHIACMQSPDFNDWNASWQDLIAKGKINWELNTYHILNEGK